MTTDTRLTRMVHVLVHLGLSQKKLSSTTIAGMLNTNAAVVRRTMAPLRKHGIVSSEDGRSGGWQLKRSLDSLTLLDVHEALNGGGLLLERPSTSDHDSCGIEDAANSAIDYAHRLAEETLRNQYSVIRLSQIAERATNHMA